MLAARQLPIRALLSKWKSKQLADGQLFFIAIRSHTDRDGGLGHITPQSSMKFIPPTEDRAQNGIARLWSRPYRDRCDEHCEIAKRAGQCDWPNATTSKHSPLEQRREWPRPIRANQASSTSRDVDDAPKLPPPMESVTSQNAQ